MFDEEEKREMTEQEIIKEAMNHISEACCFLFETKSTEGHALAFWADSLLKYGQVVYRGDNPISAACNYEEYEQENFDKFQKEKMTEIWNRRAQIKIVEKQNEIS